VTPAGALVAFAAGALSFLSPCVLPVVPGYLAVLAGFGRADDATPGTRPAPGLLRSAALFCAGFSAVFVALGLTATAAGRLLLRHHALLTRLGGAVVLLMALYLVGTLVARRPGLYGEHRFSPRMSGAVAAPLAGAAFAFGWSPCVGPVLGSVLTVAATQGRALAGGALLAAYSAGFAVPFLVVAVLPAPPLLRRLRRAAPALTVATAVVLVALGVLLVTDQLGWISARLRA
jgi:cytochrome c-type biogenesis protein